MFWYAYIVTSADRITDGSLDRALESLGTSFKGVYLGLRGAGRIPSDPKILGVLHLPLVISLSDARNILIRNFPPTPGSVVSFPDDDCWYGNGLVAKVESTLSSFDFALGVIDTSGTENKPGLTGTHVNLKVAIKRSASAAIFCRSDAFGNFTFDESLGLGAKYKSAEDLDLVLHLLKHGAKGVYNDNLRVGHPYKNRQMEYFPGAIACFRKYITTWPIMLYFIARRLVHGLVYQAQGKLALDDFNLALESLKTQALNE